MMPRKIIDTNLLVYALIEDHPAADVCEAFIREEGQHHRLATTPLTPFEVYYVLWKVYGLERREAFEKASTIFETPLDFVSINGVCAQEALRICFGKGVESNDSLLLKASIHYGIPSLASDDRRLLEACREEGVYTQCPINEELRKEMRKWEEEKLPKRGLPRVLSRIHRWLSDANLEVAEKFREATNNMRQLP